MTTRLGGRGSLPLISLQPKRNIVLESHRARITQGARPSSETLNGRQTLCISPDISRQLDGSGIDGCRGEGAFDAHMGTYHYEILGNEGGAMMGAGEIHLKAGMRCRRLFGVMVAVSAPLFLASCDKPSDSRDVSRYPSAASSVAKPVYNSHLDYAKEYIQITDVNATRVYSTLALLSLKIRNTGSRDVNNIKFVIYFYDENDKAIHEVQWKMFLDDELPLRAGYIKQIRSSVANAGISGKDNLVFTDIPDEWRAGRVTVEIQGLEFAN